MEFGLWAIVASIAYCIGYHLRAPTCRILKMKYPANPESGTVNVHHLA